jgi:catalase
VARPTTDSGVTIASDRHSLTLGPNAPRVLHDVVQQVQHFNRERLAERVVHTKGKRRPARQADRSHAFVRGA